MFETLKKNSFKSSLIASVILLILGIVLAALNAGNAFFATTGYVEFESLEPDEIKSQLVDVELVENFGCYLEEYEENTSTHYRTTTDYYYIIYTGAYDDLETDYKFMSIKVPASFGSKMDDMADNTYNGIQSSPISFSGKIQKLDDEEYEYFLEFWEEMGFSDDEIEDMTLPYYINVYDSKGSQNGVYIIVFLIGIALVVWGIIRIVKGSKGAYLKNFRQDIASIGCTESSVESDLNSAASYCKKGQIKIGRLFTYYNLNSVTPRAIPNSKIMWAYQNTTTHRTNGIKTGTTYSVMLFVEGYKNAFNVSVPNEATAQEILKKMNEMFPWIVVGYSEDLKKLFNKDRAQFLQLRYNTVEHTPVEPGFEGFSGRYDSPENQGV
ncbi:MAG: DUF6709 family protein [Acetatifactor sp.]